MKPEFSKPFNLEHARAGAPFCCASGWRAEILKFADNGLFGTMVEQTGEEIPAKWTLAGESDSYEIATEKDLVMLPLGMLEGKPVFAGDAIEDSGPDGWTPGVAHPGNRIFTGCRWPAPETAYPETQMTQLQLEASAGTGMWVSTDTLRTIANAALRHALDAGQVVLPAPQQEARCTRDMRVAKAVLAEFTDAVRDGVPLHVIDLPAIIEKIK